MNICRYRKLLSTIGKSKETLRRWDKEGKLSAVREPMSNYRVYRKSDVDTLFADFLDSTKRNSFKLC
jgi:DNA (cytosine-5)-methyltransferase 1